MAFSDNKQSLTGAQVIEDLSIDARILENKKEQTTKKVEYVKAYVEEWLRVWLPQNETKSITFIDAMSNAGVYKDGDFCTIAEVAKLFGTYAESHSRISFQLYLNDSNKKRVSTCVDVCSYLIPDGCKNVDIIYANEDVNQFLHEAATTSVIPHGKGNAILLFVDPYDMGTVHLKYIREFIQSRYCDLLFNHFSSDLTRNKNDQRIVNCFDGLDIPTDADVGEAIANALRIGRMKYVFSYPFRIVSNTELYQIIFVTPHIEGMRKIKIALWDTFHGVAYHRNARVPETIQGRLFSDEEIEDSTALGYATDAQELLVDHYSGQHNVTYEEIATFLLERTMLRDGQFINLVLKPLIKNGRAIKDGKVRSGNYKGDSYSFPETQS